MIVADYLNAMGSSFKKKSKKKAGEKHAVKKPIDQSEIHASEESGYGGLPDRNLKKNLGCG